MVQGSNQNQFVGADRQIWEILCDILRNKDTVQFFFVKLFRQVLKSVNIEPKGDIRVFGRKIFQYSGEPVIGNALHRSDADKTTVQIVDI